MQRGRLIYTVGPSGAGKDSLLAWLRAHLPPQSNLHFAKRCITRATQADGEQHESVNLETFRRLREANAFALHWQANDLHYGIRHTELAPLQNVNWVIVNGSRAQIADTASQFPNMILLRIDASPETLRARLQARGRESADAIEARIARSKDLSTPSTLQTIEIQNDATLAASGEALLAALSKLMLSHNSFTLATA